MEMQKVKYKTAQVNNLDIFYREAGNPSASTILLLHGFPTSSHMFRELIPLLSKIFHIIAPDLPGFGLSSTPNHTQFNDTSDNLAKTINQFTEKIGLEKYAMYVFDYGAPVGYRLAVAHPEKVAEFSGFLHTIRFITDQISGGRNGERFIKAHDIIYISKNIKHKR